jgi:hypothetical protein
MSSKSPEKKRKRNHDSQEPPSKRPALDSQKKPSGTAVKMVKDNNELAPVLGMEYFIFNCYLLHSLIVSSLYGSLRDFSLGPKASVFNHLFRTLKTRGLAIYT